MRKDRPLFEWLHAWGETHPGCDFDQTALLRDLQMARCQNPAEVFQIDKNCAPSLCKHNATKAEQSNLMHETLVLEMDKNSSGEGLAAFLHGC